jgi:competence ComEA-like helix-hairpin-helix protein
MNMKYLGIILFILLINLACAHCEEGQIDINSASLEELDGIYGIGPVKSQAIIDARPYEKIDDLVNAYGIGETTLEKIKEQGLACVNKENSTSEDEEVEEESEETENDEETEDIFGYEDAEEENPEYKEEKTSTENIRLETINLNSNDLKNKNKKNPAWAVYGLGMFCVLLGFLFVERRRKLRNELK